MEQAGTIAGAERLLALLVPHAVINADVTLHIGRRRWLPTDTNAIDISPWESLCATPPQPNALASEESGAETTTVPTMTAVPALWPILHKAQHRSITVGPHDLHTALHCVEVFGFHTVVLSPELSSSDVSQFAAAVARGVHRHNSPPGAVAEDPVVGEVPLALRRQIRRLFEPLRCSKPERTTHPPGLFLPLVTGCPTLRNVEMDSYSLPEPRELRQRPAAAANDESEKAHEAADAVPGGAGSRAVLPTLRKGHHPDVVPHALSLDEGDTDDDAATNIIPDPDHVWPTGDTAQIETLSIRWVAGHTAQRAASALRSFSHDSLQVLIIQDVTDTATLTYLIEAAETFSNLREFTAKCTKRHGQQDKAREYAYCRALRQLLRSCHSLVSLSLPLAPLELIPPVHNGEGRGAPSGDCQSQATSDVSEAGIALSTCDLARIDTLSLRDLPPTFFEHMSSRLIPVLPSLTSLVLEHCRFPFSHGVFNALSRVPLRSLRLTSCFFQQQCSPLSGIEAIRSLEALRLLNINLDSSGDDLKELRRLPRLEELLILWSLPNQTWVGSLFPEVTEPRVEVESSPSLPEKNQGSKEGSGEQHSHDSFRTLERLVLAVPYDLERPMFERVSKSCPKLRSVSFLFVKRQTPPFFEELRTSVFKHVALKAL